MDEQLVPGKTDLCELFTHTPEAFAEPEKVNTVLTKAQRLELRRNKSQFTAGEDNLILRGVVSLVVIYLSKSRFTCSL